MRMIFRTCATPAPSWKTAWEGPAAWQTSDRYAASLAKDDARVRTPLKEKEVTMSSAPTPGVESQNLSARRPKPVRYTPLPEILFRFLRARWPIACVPGWWAIVTLRDDVEEVTIAHQPGTQAI